MPLYSYTQQEVLWQILNVLVTIEEGLQHMLAQLGELRLEESGILFKGSAEAIASIMNALLPLLTARDVQNILPYTTHLRQAISQVTDAYETSNLLAIQSVITNKLIPAFDAWQQEIGKQGRALS